MEIEEVVGIDSTGSYKSLEAVADTTTILNLVLGKVTNSRRLKSDTDAIETQVDRKMLRVSTDLYDAPELKACQRYLGDLKKFIKSRSVPSFFRGGMYLVKDEALKEVHEHLKKAVIDFVPLVETFIAVAEERQLDAKERLGPAYSADNYPSYKQIREAYKIEFGWFNLSTPDKLARIDRNIFKEEQEKAAEMIQSATENIEKMLAIEAKTLADRAIDRLTPGPDGKAKVFRNSMVSNIGEFLKNFNIRNMGSSEELEVEVARMRQLLEGVDPKLLRESASLRADLSAGFTKVSEALNANVINKPKRLMKLGQIEKKEA